MESTFLNNNFLVKLTRNIIDIGEHPASGQSKRYTTRVALAVVILKEKIL